MTMSQPSHPEPPQAPDIPRRLQVRPMQLAGVVFLLVLPVLAVFGAFGESFDSAGATGAGIRLDVVYPSRLRYQQDTTLELTVSNTGTQSLATVSVHLERGYIDRFSRVSFTPQVTLATERAYVIELDMLAPGESRAIVLQLTGGQYGRHRGRIWVEQNSSRPAALDLTTLVFP